MKKVLLGLFILGFVSCDIYTVKNSLNKPIKVNGILVAARSCSEFVDFFNLFGDFPLSFSDENGKSLSDKKFVSANYQVTTLVAAVSIEEAENSCDIEEYNGDESSEKIEEPNPNPNPHL